MSPVSIYSSNPDVRRISSWSSSDRKPGSIELTCSARISTPGLSQAIGEYIPAKPSDQLEFDERTIREIRMQRKVVVDENAGPGSPVWEQFQRTLGDLSSDYLSITDKYPGIPDVEILDKLLSADTILLTGDRVLHCQAIERGFRSYTLNEQGQLTRRRLAGVVLSPLPQSVHRELHSDYRYQSTSDLPQRLKAELTEKQLKGYRTARRRIRSHFGSADAISQVSVTIGSKQTERGLLCGFVLQVAGHSGVAGLRASEGYCLSVDGLAEAAWRFMRCVTCICCSSIVIRSICSFFPLPV
jgi:hypothetical protein